VARFFFGTKLQLKSLNTWDVQATKIPEGKEEIVFNKKRGNNKETIIYDENWDANSTVSIQKCCL